MKRTTIYLDPGLEIRLKIEAERRSTSMSEVIREAVESHLASSAPLPAEPPGAGAYASGKKTTAGRSEETLARLRFGED